MKYAIRSESGKYVDLPRRNCGRLFVGLDSVTLYDSQSTALHDLQSDVFRRQYYYCADFRLVGVDEVAHAGNTTEVRRAYTEQPAEGTVSTRYEVDKHCPSLSTDSYPCSNVDEVVRMLTGSGERCPSCGTFTVEAIDTVESQVTYTRVAHELS